MLDEGALHLMLRLCLYPGTAEGAIETAQIARAAQGLRSNVGTPTGGLRVGVCTLDGVLAHQVLAQLGEVFHVMTHVTWSIGRT
jgi:hypothetical protein